MMKITKLSLTNFRSFKQTQTIEFAPVTLLFGPNSVGKSTVLMALFYLQQIVEKGQCNPQRLEAMNNKYVGGFQHLVHGKDLSKNITIKVEYQKPEVMAGHSYDDSLFFIDDCKERENNDPLGTQRKLLSMSSPIEWANNIAVEIEIAWSQAANTAFVCRQAVWLDNEFIAESVNTEYSPNAQVHVVNYLHPLLITDQQDEWVASTEAGGVFHPDFASQDKGQGVHSSISSGHEASTLGLCGEFHDFVLASATSEAETMYSRHLQQIQQHALFQYKSMGGVLPQLGKVLTTSIEADDALNTKRIEEIFSDIFVASLDNLQELLQDSLTIGPLRHIPDSTFDADTNIKQRDWYNGKASWDLVFHAEQTLLSKINHWLAGKDQLDLGYALVRKCEQGQIEYIHDPDSFSEATQELIDSGRDEALPAPYIATMAYRNNNITLWDLHNDIEVSAADIGAGVSQVFPLIVAAAYANKGLICVEQPELHIHPKAQVGLGDLLTQVDEKNQFLIETHSEHLILRLLRRVRETTEGTLAKHLTPVKKEDISIIYLETAESGVIAHRTLLTDDGDLETDWPNGFFDERDEELF
ncbi:DUF3696 domain-containing protein [Photobacterium sp. GB-72]|uniref:DUF3696 domain-containing protein n=1 Tax=Photobacterium sp. GB-72 TaxID=2022105 RepID=UPI000D1518B3|nr:DUF3696 domain-containing protein [Photobacterium sp. GB-72]PSV32986.1 hypothetical protein C9J40_00560 [Photobacterium sp. GB-72]